MGGHYVDTNTLSKGGYITNTPYMWDVNTTIESIIQDHRNMSKYIGYNERDLEIIERNLSECRLQDIEIQFI